MADGTLVLFRYLRGYRKGRRRKGCVDVEHRAVAAGGWNIACRGVGTVVGTNVRRMGGEKGQRLLKRV